MEVEPCDICGDVGFHEVIVSCSMCKVNCEHVYCMQIYRTSIPEDWICEPCQSKNDTAAPCKVNQDSGRPAFTRQRPIRKGKVKFIPEDEVIKLSSGNPPAKPSLLSQKASVGSKITSNIPSLTLKSKASISKLPRNGGVHKDPMTDKHASLSLSKGSAKEHIWENISDKEVQTIDLQREKPKNGPPCEALSARKSVPNADSGSILCAVAECSRTTERSNLQSIPENFNRYCKFLPSSIAAWRGQFKIHQAAVSEKLYDEFKAQPPCTVNSKAYKFSSRMPSLLQLESLPMLNVLTDVFQNDCPTLQDIALYFFPSDSSERCRSRKNFNSLFELMNAEKLMLRSVTDGVELMVFTSNELNADSRGTVATVNADAGYFLWGVFRRIRTDKGIELLPEMDPVNMIGGKEVNEVVDMDVDRIGGKEMGEVVDMDVDMIGGKDVVGRIDVVRKVKPTSFFEMSSRTLPNISPNKEEEKMTTSSHMNKLALSAELGMKIKTEYPSDPSFLCKAVTEYRNPADKLDVPPGFETRAW